MASIRGNATPKNPARKCNGLDSNPQPQQHSPLKLRLNPDQDRESSVYENSEPSSPLNVARPNGHDASVTASPLAVRRARLGHHGHQTIVSVGSVGGTPVTTLLRSGVKAKMSREPSPASLHRVGDYDHLPLLTLVNHILGFQGPAFQIFIQMGPCGTEAMIQILATNSPLSQKKIAPFESEA